MTSWLLFFFASVVTSCRIDASSPFAYPSPFMWTQTAPNPSKTHMSPCPMNAKKEALWRIFLCQLSLSFLLFCSFRASLYLFPPSKSCVGHVRKGLFSSFCIKTLFGWAYLGAVFISDERYKTLPASVNVTESDEGLWISVVKCDQRIVQRIWPLVLSEANREVAVVPLGGGVDRIRKKDRPKDGDGETHSHVDVWMNACMDVRIKKKKRKGRESEKQRKRWKNIINGFVNERLENYLNKKIESCTWLRSSLSWSWSSSSSF